MLIGIVVGIFSMIVAAVLMASTGVNPFLGMGGANGATGGSSLLLSLFLIATLLVGALAGLLVMLGLALYVIAPGLSPETAREGYGSHRTIVACLLLAVLLATVLQLIYLAVTNESVNPESLSPTTLLVFILSLQISLLLIVWIRIIRPRVITWAEMGLTADRLGQKIVAGLGTGLAIVVVAAMVEQILSRLGVEQTQMSLFAPVRSATPFQFAELLLAGAGFVPFVEEVFFRGYVFKAYTEQKGIAQAYIFGPLVFALPHVTGPELKALGIIPPALISGLILAHVFRKTGSIVPTMVAHVMNNSIAFTAIYLGLS
jgi:membrane protease YdiL (CAAX protease family)